MKIAFISNYQPTPEQVDFASQAGHELVYIGYIDAFTVTVDWVVEHGMFDGVVVTDPVCALNLIREYPVGVFQNEIVAPFDQPPQFLVKNLHFWAPFANMQ